MTLGGGIVINIEDYIKKRKADEKLNEFDLEKKSENLQTFINYVIEYFNTYVDIDQLKREMLEEDIKLRGYNKLILDYSLEIQEWLLRNYASTGHRIHRPIQNYLKTCDVFLLINDDSHFKKISYKCFASLNKKYKELEDNLSWLHELIRNEHEIQSNHYNSSWERFEFELLEPSEKIIEYTDRVLKEYKVNLLEWAATYIHNFYDQTNKWPIGHKLKTEHEFFYDYNYKNSKNLFNIDIIYAQVSHLPYLKGKKKLLEVLLKLIYNQEIDRVDEATLQKWYDDIVSLKI
jgi:hypothetical protein